MLKIIAIVLYAAGLVIMACNWRKTKKLQTNEISMRTEDVLTIQKIHLTSGLAYFILLCFI